MVIFVRTTPCCNSFDHILSFVMSEWQIQKPASNPLSRGEWYGTSSGYEDVMRLHWLASLAIGRPPDDNPPLHRYFQPNSADYACRRQ